MLMRKRTAAGLVVMVLASTWGPEPVRASDHQRTCAIRPYRFRTQTSQPSRPGAPASPLTYPALFFASPRAGWVLATSSQGTTVLRTSDGGRSWTRLALLPSMWNLVTMQFADVRRGWIATIGPAVCGGRKSSPCRMILLRTNDGGSHWTSLKAPKFFGGPGDLTFADRTHGWLIQRTTSCSSFCPDLLYSTSDGGNTWQLVRAAPRLAAMRMSWASRSAGWLGGQVGGGFNCISAIYATTNGGKTWQRQLTRKYCGLLEVGMLNTRRGWVAGGGNTRYCSMGGCDDYTLYRTINGGKHWSVELPSRTNWWVSGNAWGGFPEAPRFATPKYGWIGFSPGAGPGSGGIAITRDGGRSWKRALPAYLPYAMHPINATNGWFAGLSRLCGAPSCNWDVLHTTDGGKTWTKLHPG